MTVKELIEELNKIEDKSLPVVVEDKLDFCDNLNWQEAEYVDISNEYFHMGNIGKNWTA